MFGRSKRTHRDRQHGLLFQWRLPVGNHLSFITAIVVVALIAAGLAASVRVRVGGSVHQPVRHGSVILVPGGDEWRSLEMFALEAGPFPVREEPAADPAVQALIARGMAAASPPGYAYRPGLVPVEIEVPELAGEKAAAVPGFLPPLPPPEPPVSNPGPPASFRPVVLSDSGERATAPEAPVPAGPLQGSRYLLAYDAAGRVTRVTPIVTPPEAASSAAEVEKWLRKVTVTGGAKSGGHTAVEISNGP